MLFRPVTSNPSVTLGNRVVENVDLFFNLFDLLKEAVKQNQFQIAN